MIIGLHGKARSGKDTVADYLVKNYGFRKIAFADHLKKSAALTFNLPLEVFYDDEKKDLPDFKIGLSPRQIMQEFGELMKERFGQDFWYRIVKYELVNSDDNIVVSDVRFDYEAEMIKEHGGMIICIERNICTNVRQHISEKGINKNYCNSKIENNKGLKELYEQAELALKTVELLSI